MKKFKYLLFIILLSPFSVLAEGNITVSPASLNLEVGETKTFTISAYNAIGDVSITSSNTSVATLNSSSWGTGMVDEKQTKSTTISVTGNSVGSSTITLNIDAATFDSEDLSGQIKTINVEVVDKKSSSNLQANNKNIIETKSDNNKIKDLKVDDYELNKIDDNNYEVTVSNIVEIVKMEAVTDNEKASIEGLGEKRLEVGDNNFEIVVTAENGKKNIINVKVIRKNELCLEDLKNVINNDNFQDINISINEDSIISKEDLELIKKSKKKVLFNCIEQDKIVYTYIIDGNNLKKLDNFNILIEFINDKELLKKSNYADGIIIKTSSILNGITLKLFVGNKYSDNELVNIYSYNFDKEFKLLNNVSVKDGYIEFELDSNNEFLITMSNIPNFNNNAICNNKSKFNIYYIIAIIFVMTVVIIYIIKRNNKLKIQNSKM